MTKEKVNLDLLKTLTTELEMLLTAADGMSTATKAEKDKYVIEVSKVLGLLSTIVSEASLLMGDCQRLIQGVGAPKTDYLEKLLGGLKDPSNAN